VADSARRYFYGDPRKNSLSYTRFICPTPDGSLRHAQDMLSNRDYR
jgi:hypothetical protein